MKHVNTGEHALNKPKQPHKRHSSHGHNEGMRAVQPDDKQNYEIEGSVDCDQAKGDNSLPTATLHLSGSFVVDGVIHYLQPADLK